MHLAQIKSDERRKKILNVERHLTKDSCLCDACYRHVDRKVRLFSRMMMKGMAMSVIYGSSITLIYLYRLQSNWMYN